MTGRTINGRYYSGRELEAIRRKTSAAEFDRFLISGVVGALTGSSLIGWALGGSLLGGLVGDFFEGSDDGWW